MTRPAQFRSSSKRYSRQPRRSARRRFLIRIGISLSLALAAIVATGVVSRQLAPKSNTSRDHFDAILILGTPADADGNPTPELQDRIHEGVREYELGVAPRLIVTGGAAHNRFVEAEVMASVAQAQGVPPTQIYRETGALDTIQNACYSRHIMQLHGWHSAEVISSAAHLPRAAMIFSREPIEWRMHAAPAGMMPGWYSGGAELVETLKTVRYLLWARWMENCS